MVVSRGGFFGDVFGAARGILNVRKNTAKRTKGEKITTRFFVIVDLELFCGGGAGVEHESDHDAAKEKKNPWSKAIGEVAWAFANDFLE
jgi:hypothetical protein